MDNLRIRKLTPLECGKLMGFTREDVNAMRKVGMSDMALYHCFGDALIVPLFALLIGTMIENKNCEKIVEEYIDKKIAEKKYLI